MKEKRIYRYNDFKLIMVIYNAEVDKTPDIKPEIPDFVTKTKEYIKQHPEVIREVAGDEIQKLEAYLDTLPLGLGEIGKAKLNEFLGGTGIQGDSQQQGKDAPGQEIVSQDGQGQEEGQGIAAEDDLTISEQKEVIEFMADLSEQGFDLARIQNAVRREWGLDYHYLTIRRMLAAYYNRPESDEGNGNSKGLSTKNLKIYQELLEKNSELQKKALEFEQKVAELTAKIPPEPVKSEYRGLIRRFLSWLW